MPLGVVGNFQICAVTWNHLPGSDSFVWNEIDIFDAMMPVEKHCSCLAMRYHISVYDIRSSNVAGISFHGSYLGTSTVSQ